MRGRLIMAAAIAALFARAAGAAAQGPDGRDLAPYGFDASMEELIRLELLDAAVRYDPAPVVEAEWLGRYDRVAAVDIAATKGRYGLFEDEKLRRADIAIRGTANLRSTAFDLEFLKKRSPSLGIYLHSGFEAAAQAVYEDLRPRLEEKLKAGWSARISGHSLGAAEAIILGMMLEKDGYKVEKVVAFAPPKITDAEGWARFPSLKVIRVSRPFDPVPFLPPKSLMYGRDPYIQGGKLLFLLEGKAFTVIEGSYYDDLPDALKDALSEGRLFSAKEHLLPAYFLRLLPKESGIEYIAPSEWESYEKQTRAGAE
jgi:hypothetical protein